MRVIIYGFLPDMQGYSMKEISFFFLIFAVMIVIMGRYIEKNSINHQYLQLIRYRNISGLWRRLWIRIVLLAVVMTGALFGGIALINAYAGYELFVTAPALPAILWILSMCSIGSFQLLLGLFPRGQAVGVLVIIVVQAFSMYAYPLMGNRTCYLPGSYMMLNRTSIMTEGAAPLGLALFVETAFVFLTGMFGFRIFRRSNK